HFLTRLGDLYEAIDEYDRAAEAYSRAALMAFQSGAKGRDYQHKKLAAYYARQRDKAAYGRHTALAYFQAGQEAFWDDKLPDAQAAFVKAVEWDPQLAHAWFCLGDTLRLP